MKTLLLSALDAQTPGIAADLIRQGELVAIPTETVYGLGANGLDEAAVTKIFEAKGRPQDNPLILHICGAEQIELFCHDVPAAAYELAKKFWPGPLTMVLPARDCVPRRTTGGLSTVAVRCPDNGVTRQIIRLSGVDATVAPCTSEEYKAKHPESADRPKWSALDNRMLRCTVGNDVRDWKEALACFFAHWDGENGMK